MHKYLTSNPINKLAPFFAVIFFCFQLNAQTFTVDTIVKNGRRDNRINFAFLSDGYLSNELGTFYNNTTNINTALFNASPFTEYKNYFNSFSIRVPSTASGAKHPANASDESFSGGQPVQPVANPSNYFNSTFDYGFIHRLLVAQDIVTISNVLASNLPDYDQAFILVNSPFYGGSGGGFSTSSTNAQSAEIAIHEIGHSFANLADEYWAGTTYAAEKANMTANNNPTSIRWKPWLGINNTGIFAHGTAGVSASWFKPSISCKMQALGNPFCSVCKEAFINRIHQLVNMIDRYSPSNTAITLINTDSIDFSISVVKTNPNTTNVKWYVNNTLYPGNDTAIKVPFSALMIGQNTVKAEVVDPTQLSKAYLPAVGYIDAITWNVNKSSTLPLSLLKFSGKLKERTGFLEWEIASDEKPQKFELQKSTDGKKYFSISNIPALSNQQEYSFIDKNFLPPHAFYKLKVIGHDGAVSYSSIVKLQNSFDNFNYKVYQDAASHKYLLLANLLNEKYVSISISEASGKLILKKDFGKLNEQLSYNFDLGKFPAGIYFMKLIIGQYTYTSQLIAN